MKQRMRSVVVVVGAHPTISSLTKYSRASLKAACVAKGLLRSGNKSILAQRLMDHGDKTPIAVHSAAAAKPTSMV